jgi:hydrogenase maturation protein HypF
VQGVGFRPFVYQLATQMQLNGWVGNSGDGVHIHINAGEKTAEEFYQRIIQFAPALSRITHHSKYKITPQYYSSFLIKESDPGASVNLMLTPDYALCTDCKSELYDPESRHYQYPFTSCTNCGPRYSLIQALPYDRCSTSMNDFLMCSSCREEYNNPLDRRHYAQANSCAACGIALEMLNSAGEKLHTKYETIIAEIITALNDKKIVAVKGIGGYLLLCDAADKEIVSELRKRKHRPLKPFALLYPSVVDVENDFYLSAAEMDTLQGPVAPIVLLRPKRTPQFNLAADEIAPDLLQLGIMLPYAPLFQLIATGFQKPLVATSANISGSSIIYNDADAIATLGGIADFIVTNNRQILAPQDDSVVKFSPLYNQQIILRRSRGMAPSYFVYLTNRHETILATGALLKSSFTCSVNGNVFTSQYLGNTESYITQQTYQKMVHHFMHLFKQPPRVIIADKHPQYYSSAFANETGKKYNCPVVKVQHHKAHAAAVLAENNLLKNEQAVLCVIWDGTGLGDDENIWGGEFFVYQNNTLNRRYHFEYFPHLLADKMAKEPRLSALAICSEVWIKDNGLQSKFTDTEWQLYQKILVRGTNRYCSAVGRIFDAVASLLNLCDKQSYEGEAALLLEKSAQQYFTTNGYSFTESYFMEGAHLHKIPTATLFTGIITDIEKGKPADFIAAKFHYSLVQLVKIVAHNLQLQKIAFSGGVFQNAVLVDLLYQHLGQIHQLYFHQNLSPNDENISFGQMVYYDTNIDGIQSDEAGEDNVMNSAVAKNSIPFINA